MADDYLQTARLGGGFALTTDAQRELILIDELLRQHGTTAERAFLEALAGLRLDELQLSPEVRQRVMTWRGVFTHG